MGFTNIVRPFESVDITYPRRIVKSDATPPSNVVLKVGDNGGLKTLHYSQNYSLQTYMKKVQKELTRPQTAGGGSDPSFPGGTSPGTGTPVRT